MYVSDVIKKCVCVCVPRFVNWVWNFCHHFEFKAIHIARARAWKLINISFFLGLDNSIVALLGSVFWTFFNMAFDGLYRKKNTIWSAWPVRWACVSLHVRQSIWLRCVLLIFVYYLLLFIYASSIQKISLSFSFSFGSSFSNKSCDDDGDDDDDRSNTQQYTIGEKKIKGFRTMNKKREEKRREEKKECTMYTHMLCSNRFNVNKKAHNRQQLSAC